MRKILSLISLLVVSTTANTTYAAETILKAADIQSALSEQVLIGDHLGQPTEQIFRASGDTFYSEGGSQSQGRWEIRGDQYCSVWPPSSFWACFDVARDGISLIFITKDGKRFTVHPRS
jgi:hypothetical protein